MYVPKGCKAIRFVSKDRRLHQRMIVSLVAWEDERIRALIRKRVRQGFDHMRSTRNTDVSNPLQTVDNDG